jgi:hypothetical protein
MAGTPVVRTWSMWSATSGADGSANSLGWLAPMTSQPYSSAMLA